MPDVGDAVDSGLNERPPLHAHANSLRKVVWCLNHLSILEIQICVPAFGYADIASAYAVHAPAQLSVHQSTRRAKWPMIVTGSTKPERYKDATSFFVLCLSLRTSCTSPLRADLT